MQIKELYQKLMEGENAIQESAKLINKYREKTEALSREIDLYKDNAKVKGGEESENAKRIDQLLEKQKLLLSEKREVYRR